MRKRHHFRISSPRNALSDKSIVAAEAAASIYIVQTKGLGKAMFNLKKKAEPPPFDFRQELSELVEKAIKSGRHLQAVAESLEDTAERVRVRWATSARIW